MIYHGNTYNLAMQDTRITRLMVYTEKNERFGCTPKRMSVSVHTKKYEHFSAHQKEGTF